MGLKKILKKVGNHYKKVIQVAAPIVGGALGGPAGAALGQAVSSGISASNAAKGAKKAAKAQGQYNQMGIDETRNQLAATQGDLSPFLAAGQNALGSLSDPNAYQQSPGYQLALDQSQKQLQAGAAARGGLFSGNTAQALQANAIGLANQDYGSWWQRQAGLAGAGQNAATTLGGLRAGAGNQIAGLLQSTGGAKAAGIESGTNAINAGIGTIAGLATDYFAPKINLSGADPALAPVKVTAKRVGRKR